MRVCVRVLAHQNFPRNIIYIHLRGRARTNETQTSGRNTGDSYYIYKYHYYRVRGSVAHVSRDIMRLCWRVLACRACAMVCMYIDIDIVCSACGSCYVSLWRSVLSARSARVVRVVLVVLFVRALLSVVIWCTRAVMRCNRFSVSGGVVLPCALSCDCGVFYKCLLCVWLMV